MSASKLDSRFAVVSCGNSTAIVTKAELARAAASTGTGSTGTGGAEESKAASTAAKKGKGKKAKGAKAAGGVGLGSFGHFAYPETIKDGTVDTYHGVKVADPYRWMEDVDAAETRAWTRRQNLVTKSVLDECDMQPLLRKRMAEQFDYEKQSVPFRRGSRYFIFRKSGLQNQSVLYKADSLAGLDSKEAEVLLDVNTMKDDGTMAIRTYSFSEDGSLLAIGLSEGGSDWMTIRVRDVATGEDLPDRCQWVKFCGISWLHDNSGFFFARFEAPEALKGDKKAGTETDSNENQMLYFHKLGTDAAEDQIVMKKPDHPKWRFDAEVSDDGKVLLISTDDSCDPVNRLEYVNLEGRKEGDEWNVIPLVDNFDAGYSFLANNGRTFYFKTNLDAPRGRIVSMVLPEPGSADEGTDAPFRAMQVVVAQTANSMKWAAVAAGNKLVTCYCVHACSKLSVRRLGDAKARVSDLVLPSVGEVMNPAISRKNPEIFVKFTSYLYPGSVMYHNFEDAETKEGDDIVMTTIKETVVPGFDASEFVTEQVFAPSKDGTLIPMFVTRAKSTVGKTAPTILYGYGGFNIAIPAYFSSIRLPWLKEMGGVYAVANIRGGGEYGRDWHDAGKLLNKQNVYDDFCGCGEFLIAQGITGKGQLCSFGGSNGGLLVLATALQRPDLFSAGISVVPVADMLRFHRFTIGHAWCSDYGNADESKADFDNLYGYSPLHNVKSPEELFGQQLPALMVATGDHDDRVVPPHSFKMVATLQDVAGRSRLQTNPLIVRVDIDAGHGAGKPTSKVLDESADFYAFAAKYTGAIWRRK